jgi:hypothetical protein
VAAVRCLKRPVFTPVIPPMVDDERQRPVIPPFADYRDEAQRPAYGYQGPPSGQYSRTPSPPIVILPPPPERYGPPTFTRITHPTHSPTDSGSTETIQRYDEPYEGPPMVVQEPRRPSSPTHTTVVVPGGPQPPVVPMEDRRRTRTPSRTDQVPSQPPPPAPITINIPGPAAQGPAAGQPIMVAPPGPQVPGGIIWMPSSRRSYSPSYHRSYRTRTRTRSRSRSRSRSRRARTKNIERRKRTCGALP